MRTHPPGNGRLCRPDLTAPKRGRASLSSSANPPANNHNAREQRQRIEALLDLRRPAALPRHEWVTPPTDRAVAPFFAGELDPHRPR